MSIIKSLGFVLALSLGIVACSGSGSSGQPGADGYVFLKKQYEKHEVTVTVVTYTSQTQLDNVVNSYLNKSATQTDHSVNSSDVVAFSILEPPNYDHCTIHMMDPSVTYQPEYIGHEFTHCLYGQFHGNNLSH